MCQVTHGLFFSFAATHISSDTSSTHYLKNSIVIIICTKRQSQTFCANI